MEWYQVLTIVGANLLVFLGFMGTVVTLYILNDKKITEMKSEMKDFHGKLIELSHSRSKLQVK